jgi:hypothetical protein
MRWALRNNLRTLSSPFIKDAICPFCQSPVLPKCGNIKKWHWAHVSGQDCDEWSSEESEWHLNWKNEFPEDWQEVILEKEGKKHRADIKGTLGVIVEFQNSHISQEDLIKREDFYGFTKWVLNGKVFAQNLILRPRGSFFTFRWKWPPKTGFCCKYPVYIDMQPLVDEWILELESCHEDMKNILRNDILTFSGKLFLIKKVHNTLPCGGWGKLITKEAFIKEVKDGYIGN